MELISIFTRFHKRLQLLPEQISSVSARKLRVVTRSVAAAVIN